MLAAVSLLAALPGGAALAQSADVQIDERVSTSDAEFAVDRLPNMVRFTGSFGEEAPARLGPNYYLLLLQAPYAYDSNPIFAPTGVKGSWMFDPSAKFAFQQKLGFVWFSATSSFDDEHFTGFKGADARTWASSLKASIQLWRGAVKLYQQYRPVLRYSDNAALKSDVNDVGGGVDVTIGAVPNATADIDFNFMRRLSSAGDSDALTIRPTLGFLAGDWRVLVQPSYRVRWYDRNGAPTSRTDQSIIVPAILQYGPSWLSLGGVRGDVELSASYVRNFSGLPAARAAQWIVGPSLAFGVSDSWRWDPFG